METINCEGIKAAQWLGNAVPKVDPECHFSEPVSLPAKLRITYLAEVWRLNEIVCSKMFSTASSILQALYTIKDDRYHYLDQQQDEELIRLNFTG